MSKNITIITAVGIVIVAGIVYSLSLKDTEKPKNLSPGKSQDGGLTPPINDNINPLAPQSPSPEPQVSPPAPSPSPQSSSFRVVSPNGGEKWAYASTQTIRWSAPSGLPTVAIYLVTWFPACDPTSLPPGEACTGFFTPPAETYTIAASTENDGAFEWTVPANFGAFGFENASWSYVIKIQAGESFDQSDAPFSITKFLE